jgi:predicted ATPase
MITRVHIQNFRCLKEVDFSLAPLTALVGPNGSGKSSVLAALDPGIALSGNDYWRHTKADVSREFWLASGELAKSRTGNKAGYSGSNAAWNVLTYQLLRLDLAGIRRPIVAEPASALKGDGSNLANVFGTLTRERQAQFAHQLCQLVPLFSDVDKELTGNGQQQLRFKDRWNDSLWYAPYEVSDGTLLLTAFLALQFQENPVDLVAVEEPERGLHPYLLEQLVEMLRKLSRGEIGGRPVQVVLATHSADLLEYLQPEDVRFLDRDPKDGSAIVREAPSNDPDWQRYFDEYRKSLRSAWLSGGLGGVPGA